MNQNENLSLSLNLAKFIIYLSEEKIMDYYSSLYILEDIIETFPIKDMELLFDIIEKNLKSQQSKSVRNFCFVLLFCFLKVKFKIKDYNNLYLSIYYSLNIWGLRRFK